MIQTETWGLDEAMKFKFALGEKIQAIFRSKRERGELLSEIEELLITSDFGIEFTRDITDELKKRAHSYDRETLLNLLKEIIKEKMALPRPPQGEGTLTAYLVFGVNGTGKTTTVGKLAYRLKNRGRRVLIAAADTYRDAAIDQLVIWSERAGVPIIKQQQGADSGAVVYDSCDAALRRQVDEMVIDTAGRLHNKERLMRELEKIWRILDKKLPGAKKLKLLTLDATTGQNALSQASLFYEYVGVDGIVLTKLDSSAKGGIACSVSGRLGIPILYAGVGEKVEDLVDFHVGGYLDNLFS